jgi:cell division protein FtsL
MASLAPSTGVEASRADALRPGRRRSERKAAVVRQRRMAGGVVWIGAVAVLLVGVVAINVAVLRLNVRLDEVGRQRAQLRADTAALQSQLASAAASLRIEQAAQAQLGLVPADPEHTTYVTLAPQEK